MHRSVIFRQTRAFFGVSKNVMPRVSTETLPPPPLTQLSEEELALKQTVKQFSESIIRPLVREMDAKSEMDRRVVDGVFGNGLMGIEIQHKYGGPESSFFNVALVVEELAKVDPSVAVLVDVQNTLVAPLVIDCGTEEQKQKYLTRISKDWIGAFCLSEAGSGSDAFALKTVALPDGDDFLISGSKMWISNASFAKFFLGPKRRYLHFDEVRVQKSAILGEYGKGYKMAIECLNAGRIGIAAQMIGLAQGCFDQTVPYLQERKQFGQRIIDFQAVQHQLADLACDIEAARLLVYNAARLKEANLPFIKEAAIAKLFSSNVATKVTSKCLELMGGVGFTREFPIEKYYRDCKIGTIYEGTSNIQLNTIAKFIDTEYAH
uniref:Short/branched chain specific acyl-CoA dehydrogenase, mitochondrial n=1 Tax=Globodera rostochiensis TaxID=31243 RepID=A0A914I940_GLORO